MTRSDDHSAPVSPTPAAPAVRYRIIDERSGLPEVVAATPFSAEQITALCDDGFLEWPRFLDPTVAAELAEVVDVLAHRELTQLGARPIRGNGQYVRDLFTKSTAFAGLVRHPEALGLARTMLGPQVRVRLDCRIAFEGVAEAGVPWHMHFPGVPDPLPPWFSHPHSLHLLIYLDAVGDEEGALCVDPGSHRRLTQTSGDIDDAREHVIHPARGDCVAIHGNLWHRTRPSGPAAQRRRVLFLGYAAAWVHDEARAYGQPVADHPEVVDPRVGWTGSDRERDELLGDFAW